MAADFYLVDWYLWSGLCAGRQCRHQPTPTHDVADRRRTQLSRVEPGASRGNGDPASADRHDVTSGLSPCRAESRAMGRLSLVPRMLLFGVVAVYLLLPLTAI